MKSRFVAIAALCSVFSVAVVGSANAQTMTNKLSAIADQAEIKVTVDNFIRAATEIEMGKYLALSGGVNQLFHVREPTSLDQQPTIRMNRDTLYNMAVVDISEGATLTLPDTGERYISAMIVNQDHYINKLFTSGGTYQLDLDTFDTPYVIIVMRTLVDASDAEDVKAVNALQDQIAVKAKSSKPFILPNYNEENFEAVLKSALELSKSTPDSSRTFGAKDEVDPVRHFLGTAFGWGGLPEGEAFYLNVSPDLPAGEYKIDVPKDVPVDAFWSISIYNAEGFFERNDRNVYNINSVSGMRNDDGSMTVNFGGCEDDRVNCLPIADGWNYAVRLYRPKQEVLDGDWTFPSIEPAK